MYKCVTIGVVVVDPEWRRLVFIISGAIFDHGVCYAFYFWLFITAEALCSLIFCAFCEYVWAIIFGLYDVWLALQVLCRSAFGYQFGYWEMMLARFHCAL